jgi:hypothetical protein
MDCLLTRGRAMIADELTLESRVLPPPEPSRVYRLAVIGLALCAVAAGVGLAVAESGPSVLNTLRLVLVAVGLIVVGSALSLRPLLPIAWLIAACAFTASIYGIPSHWDSARIVARVGAGVTLAGCILTAVPLTLRCAILSAITCWHFFGIFMATTWPSPTPWTTEQIGTRVYMPYLMFMYLRNAYHFYSPDPGPASLIFALVKFDSVDPKTGKPLAEWMVVPNRATDTKDPLGLTYYRRLSITEQLTQAVPPLPYSFEQPEVAQRRLAASGSVTGFPNYPKIPLAPEIVEPQAMQYRMPRPDILRYLLPSYANHILTQESRPDHTAVSVKLYRLEHRIVTPYMFASDKSRMNPHHPTTFRPFYLGEFARNPDTGLCELVDPQDPLLYWLVPILPRLARPNVPNDVDFEDFMSTHAGYAFDWRNRKP